MKATSETGALTHHEVQELLGSYVAQALPAAQAEAVRAHLAECEDCRGDLALDLDHTGRLAPRDKSTIRYLRDLLAKFEARKK